MKTAVIFVLPTSSKFSQESSTCYYSITSAKKEGETARRRTRHYERVIIFSSNDLIIRMTPFTSANIC